ncbi:uncharacterized protein LOC105162774 [Sesamum indicum]|uniref:Uncharacterized protein LOC105162774 n=1 Tax=Sesamum indicum TaxID=4182 RepID=A0A6I9T5L3_SESIN|nr:uncharacterized protein LOC105162774 [Sesamum indicum]
MAEEFMMDPLPELKKAFSIIFAVQQQRSLQTQIGDSNTNSAYQVSMRDGRGPPRQMQKRRVFFDKDKRNLVCAHCHKQGHLKETSFQIHGTPEWYKALNEKKKQSRGTFNFAGNVDAQGLNKSDTTLVKVESQTDIASMTAEFLKIMKDLGSKHVLAKGKLHKRLYILRSNVCGSLNASTSSILLGICTAAVECSDVLWHARMGHASIAVIKCIPACNISRESQEIKCDICPQAKQSRIPFKNSDSRSAAIFDLVHLDVWGPYKTPSLTGFNYVLTILDDYSRSLWTYLLKHKDQVASTLQTFVALVETQYETKIKVIRSDNGDVIFHELTFPFAKEQILDRADCPLPTVTAGTKDRDSVSLDSAPNVISVPLDSDSMLNDENLQDDVTALPQSHSQMIPRRSSRISHRPVWLEDFVCHHGTQFLQPFSADFKSFVVSLTSLQKPRTFAEAANCPNWQEAMNEELKALENYHT